MPVTRAGMREAMRVRSRRIRALLAGGLVLGVGAAATLAAWNDTEQGAATFASGTFGIVGSTDGTNFSDHATAGLPPAGTAAALNFQVAPTAMVPGTTTYALFSVRTASGSIAGDLALTAGSSPEGTGLAPYLTYGVRTIPAGSVCGAASFAAGDVVVPAGSALTASSGTTQPIAANGGSTVNYCFAVSLPIDVSNDAQGRTAIQTWRVQGTSS